MAVSIPTSLRQRMHSVQGCKSQCQGGVNITLKSLVASRSPLGCSHELGWVSKYRISFHLWILRLPKTVGWESQSSSLKWATSGGWVPFCYCCCWSRRWAGDEQGRIHPATVALRPVLQTMFGSDMGILECGNKTRPNIERTSGVGAFKPSSVLHSACQHTSLTFNVKSKQMCLWAEWLSSIHFFSHL